MIAGYRQAGELTPPIRYMFRRYVPGDPEELPYQKLFLKTRPGTTAAFEDALDKRLRAQRPAEWYFSSHYLPDIRAANRKVQLLPLIAAGIVAGFLMLMVVLGLTGVLWQNVTQRTREIGLRRAKGASRAYIYGQILGELMVMTTMAVLLGAVLLAHVPFLNLVDDMNADHLPDGRGRGGAAAVRADGRVRVLPGAAGGPGAAGAGAEDGMSERASARSPATILVVDDDSSITASLALLLKQAGYRSLAAANPAEALERLAQTPECALVLQDMNFTRTTTGAEGLELLRQIRSQRPGLPVILMTAWGSIGLAVEGMKAGASDFVTKPWNNAQLLSAVETALGLAAAPPGSRAELPSREALDEAFDFGPLVGEDPRLRRVLQIIGRVAPTDASVLITGESGTGKELVAEALHRNSRRRGGPFVKVNLGGISPSLFDSEMFGHVKGAFTDARSDRQGRFALAHGGTIFLDEIGELDAAGQVKLLRVLQDRTYEVLGSSTTRQVDVRVVAATNRNLPDMVGRGLFREDLLYRLNLIAIHLPPLRERGGDIARLARQFLGTLASVYRRDRLELSPPALRFLEAQSWPGNIRQLKQFVERAVLISPDAQVLEVGHLQATAAMEAGR